MGEPREVEAPGEGAQVAAGAGPAAPGGAAGRRAPRSAALGTVVVVVIATVVVLAGVWLVSALSGQDQAAPGATASANGSVTQIGVEASAGPAPKVGQVAPDFTTFTTDGKDLELSALKGKPVWLVFGATWCANCRAETPDIEELKAKYGEKVEIVAVYVGETISTAADYATRLKLTYPQVADASKTISSAYRVVGLPTHYFIGTDGTVKSVQVGGLTGQAASGLIDQLLAS